MSEIQQSRYDQLLRRVADLKGPGSKVNDALGELFPVLNVEDLQAELLVLMGTRLAGGGAVKIGDVGEFAAIQLFNPLGSGLLLTITRFNLSSSASTSWAWGIATSALPVITEVARFRDTRAPFSATPAGQIRTDSIAVQSPVTFRARVNAGIKFTVDDEKGLFVLGPGFGFTVVNGSTATLNETSFYWRERVAEPSELAI